ncbi:hypothetical protein D3C86_1951120 [compost metagenome]
MYNSIAAKLYAKFQNTFVTCIVGDQFVFPLIDCEQRFSQRITFKATSADGTC